MSNPSSIAVTVRIAALYAKEGGQWVVSCPALRFAAQGDTLREAKAEFESLLRTNIEIWQSRGVLGDVLREAMREPSPLRPSSPRRTGMIDIPVPPQLLAGRGRGQRQAA